MVGQCRYMVCACGDIDCNVSLGTSANPISLERYSILLSLYLFFNRFNNLIPRKAESLHTRKKALRPSPIFWAIYARMLLRPHVKHHEREGCVACSYNRCHAHT